MNHSQARSILGVDRNASEDDIKSAYRKLAMKHHPDRGGDEEQFKKIKEAFETLEKPEQQQNTFNGFGPQGVDINDMMSKFGFGGFQQKQQRRFDIEVSIDEAFRGCTKRIGAPFNIMVQIPAGVSEQQCIHTVESAQAASFFFVKIKSEYVFDWDIYDLSTRGDVKKDYLISPFKLITGGWEEISTLDGSVVSVRVPAGMQANKQLKIKEKGYWRDSSLANRSDLYLRMIPDIRKISDYPEETLSKFIQSINEITKIV